MKVEFTDKEITIMQTALDKWGLAAQAGQTVEECLEKYLARDNGGASCQTVSSL